RCGGCFRHAAVPTDDVVRPPGGPVLFSAHPTAAHSNVAALPDFSADRRRAGVAHLSGAAPRPPCAPGQIAGRPHPFSVLIVPDCFVPARGVAARRGGAVLQLAVFDPVADVAVPTGGAVRPVAGPAAGVAPGPG